MDDRHFLQMYAVCLFALCLCSYARADGKVWHVSQKNLPGIEPAEQVRTVAEAVSRVGSGDTVIIHNGIYRQRAVIEKSGLPGNPITFLPAAGANVIMTGADRITEWTQVQGKGRICSTHWPYRFVAWNQHGTHPADDYHRLIGRCEQVFINGYALHQVLERDMLTRGSFYSDLDDKRLYVWSYDNQDITGNKAMVEASARDQILIVKGDHIIIKGIRFRCAANRAQQGAVEFSGNHLTIVDCVFEYTNSSGAEFTGEDITVRRCTFQNNGQLGFGASRAHSLLMTECTVRNNNTKGFNRGWEAGGNKICLTRGAVIENSTFMENRGNGIWFDIGNEACTVRNCLIAFNEDAGIFYEISYGLHAHDNVIVGNGLADTPGAWGASAGISLSSSPNCLIERNLLLGNKEGFNFREQTRSTPRIEDNKGQPVWNHDEVIRNNVIAYNRDAQTWGWFDISDDRHWPALGNTGDADPVREHTMRPKQTARGHSLTGLEKLAITLKDNLYSAGPGEDLFNWGVTWKKHKRYQRLEQVQQELNLEQGSTLAEFVVNDFSGLDFRVPADSPAIKMGCYPNGEVPGVKLGTYQP